VVLAGRGQRNLDDGPRAIDDADERRLLQRQARTVNLQAPLAALALTAIAFLLP
jgi:hypothetical protein